MTGRDLISASLRLIGALGQGESLDAQEATDGLAALNRMVDSWSNEELLVYARVREPLTLAGGTSAYTMGSGGALNTTRPMKIDAATVVMSGTIEVSLRLLSLSEWAAIPQKTITGIPERLYVEPGYPLTTLNFYPVPSSSGTAYVYSWKPLSAVAIDTAISLPPGYERALVYNGALELAPEYGRQVPEAVAMIAIESKADLKRVNFRPSYLSCDPATLGTPGRFNILTGDYNP